MNWYKRNDTRNPDPVLSLREQVMVLAHTAMFYALINRN